MRRTFAGCKSPLGCRIVMAKSARPGGKGKETHFNRPASGAGPARGGRPRSDEGDRPSYRKDEGSDRRSGSGYAGKRDNDSRSSGRGGSGYQRDENRPRRDEGASSGSDRPQRREYGSDRGGQRPDRGQSGERRSFGNDRGDRNSSDRSTQGRDGERRSYSDRNTAGRSNEGRFERKDRNTSSDRRPYGENRGGDRDNRDRTGGGRPQDGERRSNYGDRNAEGRPERKDRDQSSDRRSYGENRGDRKPDRPARPQGEGRSNYGDRNTEGRYERKDRDQSSERRSYGENRGERSSERPSRPQDGERRNNFGDRKNEGRYERRDDSARPPRRNDGDFSRSDRPARTGDKPEFRRDREGNSDNTRRPEDRPPYRGSREGDSPRKKTFKPRDSRDDRSGGDAGRKPYGNRATDDKGFRNRGPKPVFNDEEFRPASNPAKPGKWDSEAKNGPMTLNKYLAHSGISSRREAATIIKEGKVEVNGQVLTEPGYRVQPGDRVVLEGAELKPQRHHVYVLLNKPKDFLTTTEDDRGRRTVMELVEGATEDRLYPIGRLDRNTTGVLLLTNDGDLAQKLSHPKYESKKIYQVSLDKDLTKRDFEQIIAGVTLEDGVAVVDRLAYLEKKSEIGLEIHSGRNRIVRRIFESLGYEVVKLDRVMYAGLTKKNVSRGKWRLLTEREVIQLKHFRS